MKPITKIKAKNAKEGMILHFFNPEMDIIIDDVDFCRDGDVKLSIGHGGTGTEFYDPEEYIWVRLPQL